MQILVTQMFLSFTTMVSQSNKCLKRHRNLSENPQKPLFKMEFGKGQIKLKLIKRLDKNEMNGIKRLHMQLRC